MTTPAMYDPLHILSEREETWTLIFQETLLLQSDYDLNDFSSNYQFASASVLSAIGRKGKRGYLSKCFLIAVFYMWLSHNWNKCLGQLWYELLFQSVIGMSLSFLISSQMTVHQVTVFHLKATTSLSVKRCISCLTQYSGDWGLILLSTWNKITSETCSSWKSAIVSY